jgi:hypothetical protein
MFNRVVRRCFLLGDDPVSGKNFDHRKQWIEDELEKFSGAMGIDLLGFSILSNHFHLLLRSRPDVVATWDDTGKCGATPEDIPPILERLKLSPSAWCELVSDFGRLFSTVAGHPRIVDGWRSRRSRRRFHLSPRVRELLS